MGYTEEVRSVQTAETCTVGTETGKCAPDHCNVQIGDSVYCSQCSNGGSDASSPAPTNGVCSADNNECSFKAAGRCTTCAYESFMFQGGCYRTGQDPGQTMCQTAQDGKCTLGADGYFALPEAAATEESVAACNTTMTITLANNKKYVGVDKCKTCTQPNAASDTNTAVAATCTACEDGYFVNSNACEVCQDENCAACAATGNNKCSKCKTTGTKAYLKVESGSTGTCVAASGCGSGFFPRADDKTGNKCTACGTASDGGIADCAECSLFPSASGSSTTLITCTKCSTKKLSPLRDACLAACPAGTYNDNNICKPCHTSCASCENNANQDSCTACYPGSVLSKSADNTKGTCIPECTGRYAENCEAGMCTASIGGSKYCSKCKSGYVPVDGICVLAETARAAPAGCTPNSNDGVCTACTEKYFLESGGCYQAEKFPGNTLCTTADAGQCTTCANGQDKDSNGSCPACPTNCASCAKDSAKTCNKCLSGYYLDANKACKKCSETSGNIQGMKNCVSCEKPSNGNGAVTCYVTQTPAVDPTDPSVNKGGLSSGAIAGISVAVIVVVGGLVGFLCWWFLYRTKKQTSI